VGAALSASRPLLVGEAPSRDGRGRTRAFDGRSGARLSEILGTEFVRDFDAVNLLDRWPGSGGKGSTFPVGEARAAASMLLRASDARVLVLCGRRVAAAFGLRDMEYLSWRMLGPKLVGLVPHPSGVNRWYNEQANQEAARAFLLRARRADPSAA
jgi:uracil-DNA glycosylase